MNRDYHTKHINDVLLDYNGSAKPQSSSPTASQKYARRRRHKTKSDRYDYKAETSADIKRSTKAKSRKRHTHTADGATLNQDFKAPNVESERLTLKHGSMPGFLAKGKASDAIARRGLPDLTFSEMAFLGKKRQLDEARFRGIQAMVCASKNRGGAREISGYFEDQAVDDSGNQSPKRRPGAHMPTKRTGPQAESSWGRRDEAETTTPPDGRLQVLGSRQGEVYHSQRAIHQDQIPSQAMQRSTSVSWPMSPSRDVVTGVHQQFQDIETIPMNRDVRLSHGTELAPHATRTIHPQSSVSNATATKRPEATAARQHLSAQQRAGSATASRHFYSLDDLRRLANDMLPVEADAGMGHTKETALWSAGSFARTSDLRNDHALPAPSLKVYSSTQANIASRALRQQSLARADPSLMPGPAPVFEETPVQSTSVKAPQAFITDCLVSDSVDDRALLQLESPLSLGHNVENSIRYEEHAHDRNTTRSQQTALSSQHSLDRFDVSLLHSIQCPVTFPEAVDDLAVFGSPARPAWTMSEDTVDVEAFRSGYRVARTPGAATSSVWTHGEGLSGRTELLRPSEHQGKAFRTFDSFKRPRLLY